VETTNVNIGTLGDDDAKLFDHKINIGKHIRDTHVIAAFNDMAMRGTAKFVLRDDGVLLMIIRNETKEEVLFKVTRTGLFCLAHLKT
jgi:hypothetical protein